MESSKRGVSSNELFDLTEAEIGPLTPDHRRSFKSRQAEITTRLTELIKISNNGAATSASEKSADGFCLSKAEEQQLRAELKSCAGNQDKQISVINEIFKQSGARQNKELK